MRNLARCLLLVAGASLVASTARGEPPPGQEVLAERLFQEGRQLMADGSYGPACAKLAASLRLDAGIGTMLYLADCFERNGQTASAWEQFREAAAAAARVSDGREKVARARAAGLEPKLSKLTIVLKANTVTPAVARDEIPVDVSLLGREVPVDPGRHVVTASAEKKKTWRGIVDVPPVGASVTIVVPDLEDDRPVGPAAISPAAISPAASGGVQRAAGLATFGAGVVAVGVGAYLGFAAKSKWDDAEPRCRNACDGDGFDARSDARNLAGWATAAFIGGAAAMVGGAVLFFTAAPAPLRSARLSAAVAPGRTVAALSFTWP